METITETALKGLSHLPEQWEKSNRGVKRRRPSQPCATQTVNGNCRKDTKGRMFESCRAHLNVAIIGLNWFQIEAGKR